MTTVGASSMEGKRIESVARSSAGLGALVGFLVASSCAEML
ncbi:hypothetical protein ACWEKJ_13485 [Amycolatopsis thermoflava]